MTIRAGKWVVADSTRADILGRLVVVGEIRPARPEPLVDAEAPHWSPLEQGSRVLQAVRTIGFGVPWGGEQYIETQLTRGSYVTADHPATRLKSAGDAFVEIEVVS